MVQTAKFWDKSAEKYAKSPIRDEEGYKKKLEATRKYFTPDSEVFEFACGTGTTAIAHASYVKHITAVDISSKMVEIAQAKATDAGIENVTFKQSTIEEFELNGEPFDVIMAHSILHLLEDPQDVIKKVFRMLKPDGAFVTSTVCLGDSTSFWRVAVPVARFFRAIPYVNMLKRSELEKYFENAGFEIDYQWERQKKQAAFIIARKPAG